MVEGVFPSELRSSSSLCHLPPLSDRLKTWPCSLRTCQQACTIQSILFLSPTPSGTKVAMPIVAMLLTGVSQTPVSRLGEQAFAATSCVLATSGRYLPYGERRGRAHLPLSDEQCGIWAGV